MTGKEHVFLDVFPSSHGRQLSSLQTLPEVIQPDTDQTSSMILLHFMKI